MNVVAINVASDAVFQSQMYVTEEEKVRIESSMVSDAELANIKIEIRHLSNEELRELI